MAAVKKGSKSFSAEENERLVLRVFAFLVTLIRVWEIDNEWLPCNIGIVVFGVLAMATGSKSAMILASLANMGRTWLKLPEVWDNYYWDLQTDLAFIVCAGSLRKMAAILKWQYPFFYTAAAFWKINGAFLDPKSSCATIFTLQHLGAVFGEETALKVVPLVALASPAMTLALESLAGLGMFFRPEIGALFAFVLHSMISLTPRPNNISSFSAKCAPKLLLYADIDVVASMIRKSRIVIFGLFLPVYVALLRSDKVTANWWSQDYATAIFFPQALLSSVAIVATMKMKKTSKRTPLLAYAFGLLAFMYSYLLIPLGVNDLGAPSMYSNLKFHGGSNHLLMPTAYLQRTRFDDTSSVFFGGIVRVEDTNSSFIRQLYPGDQTDELEPLSMPALLTKAGYTPPRMYHPAVGRVIGLMARPPRQSWVPFTFFAFELRRLVAEANADNEGPFSITYARLPGMEGDELWRAEAFVSKTTAHFDHNGSLTTCKTTHSSSSMTQDCAQDEIAKLPPLPWYALKTMLFLPYPVLVRDPDTPDPTLRYPPHPQCFGP